MKQRLQQIAKASFYSALTIAIIAVTVLLVTIGRGYFFDFKTGQLSGGGLILVDSEPGNATILIDGEPVERSTAARLSMRADDYLLRLEKEGYRSWEKTLSVVTSEVTWAQYPLLLPVDIETTEVEPLTPPLVLEQSPDQNYLAIASAKDPQLRVLESGESATRPAFSLTAEQLAAGFKIESLQWSVDSEHVLVGLRNPQQLLYVVVSVVNNQDVFNISSDFSLPLDNLQFSTQNWREIYWLSPEGLRKLDLANRTVSAVLASDVTSFRVSADAVFFTQNTKNSSQLARLERDNQVKVLVDDLPIAGYFLEYSGYGDNRYVALLNRDSRQVWLYHNPVSPNQQLRKFEHVNADSLQLSFDERFLLMKSGGSFTTYDSEFENIHRFELSTGDPGALSWLDNFHLLGRGDGQAIMFEFDGGNVETITSAANYPVFGSRDRKLLYSVGSNSAGIPVLQISRLAR